MMVLHVICTHTFGANFIIHTFFLQISFFLSSYVIPLALISILYVGMLIRLWHSAPGSKVSAESRRGKKRVTRMVVFVVLGEEVCIIIRQKLIFGFTLSLCNVLAANPRKWNFLIILISKRGDVSRHHNVNILSAFLMAISPWKIKALLISQSDFNFSAIFYPWRQYGWGH